MTRLALVWELGAGSSYVAFMAQLGHEARARGYECVFIVRDLHIAATLLPPDLGPLVQAPLATASRTPIVRVQTSYATLLHNNGFADAEPLAARLRAWRALFESFGVKHVIARHSPTALLAARAAGLPVLHYGNAFSMPPDRSPWPSFRPDAAVSEGTLLHNEARVLTTINSALEHCGWRSLERLSALFAGLPSALLDYPELDHCAGAGRGPYLGFPDINFGDPPQWPETDGSPRVFASLLPTSSPAWTNALGTLPATTLLRFRGQRAPAHALKLPPRVRLAPPGRSLNFKDAIAGSNAVIGYGSHNLVCEALLAGRPVVVIAHSPDELLLGLRVRALRAGILLPTIPDDAATQALRRFLDDPSHTESARAFALRHASGGRDGIARRVLDAALGT
jgi:UDP:flavonoid glycosyltransferase YjiC (YdhE family)